MLLNKVTYNKRDSHQKIDRHASYAPINGRSCFWYFRIHGPMVGPPAKPANITSGGDDDSNGSDTVRYSSEDVCSSYTYGCFLRTQARHDIEREWQRIGDELIAIKPVAA